MAPGYTPWLLLLSALTVAVSGCPQLLDEDFRIASGGGSGAGGSSAAGSGDGATGGAARATAGAPSAGGSSGTGGGAPTAGSAGAGGAAGSAGATGFGGASGSAGASGSGGSSGSAGATSCPEGALVGPGDRCYVLVSESTSWATARSGCRARGTGWDLMSIRSATDTAFLSNVLTAEAWVGADDSDGTEIWRWVDDGTEFWEGSGAGTAIGDAYVNWNTDEPNGGGGHDCLRVLPSAAWADLDCGDGRTSVCEGPQE
jgi:hypothetical protein